MAVKSIDDIEMKKQNKRRLNFPSHFKIPHFKKGFYKKPLFFNFPPLRSLFRFSYFLRNKIELSSQNINLVLCQILFFYNLPRTEILKPISQTLTTDDPSPKESSLVPQENLDEFPVVSSLIPDSLTGSSSVSPMAVDSLDLETVKNVVEEETVAGPSLSDSLFNTPPPPASSTESEPSQALDSVPNQSNEPEACSQEEEEEDRWQPYSGFIWTHSWSKPLHPEQASRTEVKLTGVGAGLENLGNTCFINAVLQCFTHTVPFVLGLRSLNHHEKPCDRNIEGFCLLCALHDQIKLSLNSSGGIISPYKIFNNLNYFSSFFQRYQQEDAHEFLQCLLDRLESCCSKLKNESSSLDDRLVKNVFGGRLVSRLCCCNCGHISCSYEPLNDLSLEIEDVDSLPTALESFTRVEKIEDLEPKFRCENCNAPVSVEKQLMLDQAPSVATFHLKRFKTEGTYIEKIDKHVDFPLELDLQPYTIANGKNNEELRYQLYAVVKHSGFRPTSGHYVCYIRSSPDTWHKMNDSRVTSVAEEVVLSQEAYILLYAKQGTPWFSTAIEVQKPCEDPRISDSSPKSVLDNMDFASTSKVENSADVNESKDAVDRTSIWFSCETQNVVKVDEPSCVVGDGISGVSVNESELCAPRSIDSIDDTPMTDASIPPPGSTSCSDERAKDCGSPSMPARSQCPYQSQTEISGAGPRAHVKDEKRGGVCRRAEINKTPETDQATKEAIRNAKKMVGGRGAKFMALLTPQTSGKTKKRMGSSPCKRVSPRTKHGHNLMRPVPVSR